jgi:hypothetical protein
MPLQRKLGSSRSGLLGVEFSMMAQEGTSIPCIVTRDSLRRLFGSGGMATVGQLAVFDRWRDQIEAVASQKWDCSQVEDGRVFVRPEDLIKIGL